jgi:hypothetical protein
MESTKSTLARKTGNTRSLFLSTFADFIVSTGLPSAPSLLEPPEHILFSVLSMGQLGITHITPLNGEMESLVLSSSTAPLLETTMRISE